MKDVKITVVEMMEPKIFKELAADHMTPQCTRVKVGQEFISTSMDMPEGFCSWAWADVQRDVIHLATGGEFPWIKTKGKMVSACTDGLRPVIFKLERIE